MQKISSEKYKEVADIAIRDPLLQKTLVDFQTLLGNGAVAAFKDLPDGAYLRDQGQKIRKQAVENLDLLLENLANGIRKNGGNVYFAKDGAAAVEYCLEVARKNSVKLIVKGKSMVSEEIGLNEALQAEGIESLETDLGEYIVQLAEDRPSHIIAPAIHKTREQIGELFRDKLDIPYSSDPPTLTQAAREKLREKFLSAQMGITGCNMACAETGHITTVSNEGNIRMSSTLPGIHVALMGMERVTANLEDHHVLIRLLTMSASIQKISGYLSYIGGPRHDGQTDGPDQFHLVILDNGRNRILADEAFRESLQCIRCAACLNVCPVYRKIGGHAYGSPYSGPIGAVITPLLAGINQAKHLCLGETLCGTCLDICPVKIDIPGLLLKLRNKLAEGDEQWQVKPNGGSEALFFKVWSRFIQNRRLYESALGLFRFLQKGFPRENGMISRLPPPFKAWTQSRNLKPLAKRSFMQRWKSEN